MKIYAINASQDSFLKQQKTISKKYVQVNAMKTNILIWTQWHAEIVIGHVVNAKEGLPQIV